MLNDIEREENEAKTTQLSLNGFNRGGLCYVILTKFVLKSGKSLLLTGVTHPRLMELYITNTPSFLYFFTI